LSTVFSGRHQRTTFSGRRRVHPRTGGLAALRPKLRCDTGGVRRDRELFDEAAALRLELPTRSAAAIADILWRHHDVRIPERTIAAQLRRRGLHRAALAAEPKVFGRYEAEAPNERWITDVLVGPWVPYPKTASSIRARLFLIVDDHSRLLVHGRFQRLENTRPAKRCYEPRSCDGACPRSFTPTTERRSQTRCWPARAPPWGST
jgi:putative transposase